MTERLTQQVLELLYHDAKVRRTEKEALTDWILDTQSRTAPLAASELLAYLANHQSEVLHRLQHNVRLTAELAQALRGAAPGGVSRAEVRLTPQTGTAADAR
jgi:hypothetical protein